MSAIIIRNIKVGNPKDQFLSNIELDIELEVFQELSKEFEIKIVYIGSADNPSKDQVLELSKIQPLPLGTL